MSRLKKSSLFLFLMLVGCTVQMVRVYSTPSAIQKPTEEATLTVPVTEEVLEVRRVIVDVLNIRTGPGEEYLRVSDTLFLYHGEFVRVYEVRGQWLRIHPRWDWWVNGDYTR